jgi:probable blue pigment (indigoidine) exporter
MSRNLDILTTAVAPVIWGSTYIVTTEFLPPGYPMTVAMLRALPAGLLLLFIMRQLPSGIWWGRSFILGGLNIGFFQAMLFIAAYRLPGGVAAVVGAIQPLIVVFLAHFLLGSVIRSMAIIAALAGLLGVALLVLTPAAALDSVGIAAGLIGALSMAAGTVLSRRWQPPVPPLTFTAWQLTTGGILLVPVALLLEPQFPSLNGTNILGLVYLSLIGAAFTYGLWFRGLARLEPSVLSTLALLSPVAAMILGWVFLDQTLSPLQASGMLIVIASVWLGQRVQGRRLVVQLTGSDQTQYLQSAARRCAGNRPSPAPLTCPGAPR